MKVRHMVMHIPARNRLWEVYQGCEKAGAALAFAERNGADLDEAYVTVEDDRITSIGGWSLGPKEDCETRGRE